MQRFRSWLSKKTTICSAHSRLYSKYLVSFTSTPKRTQYYSLKTVDPTKSIKIGKSSSTISGLPTRPKMRRGSDQPGKASKELSKNSSQRSMMIMESGSPARLSSKCQSILRLPVRPSIVSKEDSSPTLPNACT